MNLESGFDFTKISHDMLSQVPLWFLVWAIFRAILHRWTKSSEVLDQKLQVLTDSADTNRKLISEHVSTIHEKLNRIEIKLVASGVDDLRQNLDQLKEARVRTDMKLEAVFRYFDDVKKVGS